ncbi:alpha/beta hydrolase-fold protein [Xiamenia xianingshaonis]|uniref:Alpha/beta hydrolase n=1 Tax=Xiamenia xianingshaonis TaxID=2682776 RepID=A0A9E6SUA7_9ACTN|nr:alpha/beta hydrolase-fold protein [Xiamenia xianingshaonis]NHM14693.1 alpha/beta hydrolase [Xiamenia xianingshaonis]QTU84276.1 alpha/beta hydrolase [Xiamenia xianingshaonis]
MDCRATLHAGSGGEEAPTVYFVDLPKHPFDLAAASEGLGVNVVGVKVPNWDDALTPWPAPPLYREQRAFGGQAQATLDRLLAKTLPCAEATFGLRPSTRAIAGYSLGGLFAAWALLKAPEFAAAASMSGSLWFEGWDECCARACTPNSLTGRFAYFSVGTGEKRASSATFRRVEDRTRETVCRFQDAGAQVTFATGPGKHFDHVTDRIQKGLAALDAFFAQPCE